jgi:hypothetical protein
MPRKTDITEWVRTVGLASSLIAVAAIGLALVADGRVSEVVGPGTRTERIFLLAVAGVLCIAGCCSRFARIARK